MPFVLRCCAFADTEGSLIAERVVDMAHALVGEVSSIAAASNNPQKVYAVCSNGILERCDKVDCISYA